MKTITKEGAQALLLSALANEKRLLIFSALASGEITVNELSARVGLSQSATSQHLSKLRQLRLVSTRRDAQTIYYSTRNHAVVKILETLQAIYTDERTWTVTKAA